MTLPKNLAFDPKMPAVLLDIRGLLMRSYYSGSDSHPVYDADSGVRVNSAAHGAANFMERILLPILKDVAPINIIVVADGGSDLRRAAYPGYKAKRAKKRDDEPGSKAIGEQLNLLTEHMTRLMVYLGATAVKVNGREADDVIDAIRLSMPDQQKMIYTVDGDLTAMCNDHTHVILFDEPAYCFKHTFDTSTGKDYNEIEPHLVTLYKSLIGDTSDEYPGIKGFGPKKWRDLCDLLDDDGLRELDRMARTGDFKDLDDTVAANPQFKVLNLLATHKKDWQLMYYLARFHPESIWSAAGKRLIKPVWTKRLPDQAKALAALVHLKIDDYLPELQHWFPTQVLANNQNLGEVFEHVNEHMDRGPTVGFDYESYDTLRHAPFQEATKKGEYVDVLSQKLTGASICYGANLQHNVYLPCLHKDTDNISPEYYLDIIDEVQAAGRPLAIQNAGFEMTVTAMNFGEQPIHRPHDTRIMGAYYDENMMGLGQDGLKDMAWNLLRYRQTEYKELLESAGVSNMAELTGEQVMDYGCDDSFVAAHLWVLFRWALLLEGQWGFFVKNHTAPNHIMEKTFRDGVNIDWDVLAELTEADQKLIETSMARLRELLTENCTDLAPEESKRRVDAFIDSDRPALMHSLTEKYLKQSGREGERIGADRREALWQELRLSLLQRCSYTPYGEVQRTYEFLGTPAQLRDVTTALEFPDPLNKNSGKGINEWLEQWADTKLTELQDEFLVRLAEASGKPIRLREGPEFLDLQEICAKIMQPHMPVDKVGDELNLGSPQQVQHLIYLKMGFPVRRRSKVQRDSNRYKNGFEGSPSTDKRAINAALAEDCQVGGWQREALECLREVTSATTRFGLFHTPYPMWKHPLTGMVHPGIKDPGTVTRRPTSGRPNVLQVAKGPTRLMFIPMKSNLKDDEWLTSAAKITKAPDIFIPKLPKRLIMAPDFSGQELRITGSEAQDPELIKAYTGGRRYVDKYGVERLEVTDIHSLTTVIFLHRYVARELGNALIDHLPLQSSGRVEYEWYQKIRGLKTGESLQEMLAKPVGNPDRLLKVMQAARGKVAKPTNFLITYLGTAPTLAENTSLPEDFCRDVMDEVFKAYGRLDPWQQETIEFGRKRGFVATAYGTRKHLSEDILSSDRGLRSREERRACNQVVQGCAADILHTVETDIYEQGVFEAYDVNFIAPVYDELAMDVPLDDNLPELISKLATIMDLTPPGHAIPMMAEFSFGPNWAEQYELGERPHERQVEEALSALFKESA